MADRRALEEYERDLLKIADDRLVADIVNDFRTYSPTPRADPKATATPMGAGRVTTPDIGPKYRAYVPPDEPTDRSGWTTPPSVDRWRAPGLEHCDRLMDQQDAADRLARVKELGEAQALARAEAEFLRSKQREAEDNKPKGKGSK